MLRVKIEAFDIQPDEQGYAREFNRREISTLMVAESEWEKLPEFVALTLRGTIRISYQEVPIDEMNSIKGR